METKSVIGIFCMEVDGDGEELIGIRWMDSTKLLRGELCSLATSSLVVLLDS
jgi:hypothetical protein